MKAIYTFFRSTKLAIVLILYLAAASIVATLIPQGRETSFYLSRYTSTVAELIIHSGFDGFFSNFLFLFPVALFFINLLVCSVSRLVLEIRGQRKRTFGPDIIHLGLLLLLVGSVISASTRQDMMIFAEEGDRIALPGGYVLVIESFDFRTYDGGRPKDWITTVDAFDPSGQIRRGYPIEVNRPLRLGELKIYQSSYRTTGGGDRGTGESELQTGLLIKKEKGLPVVIAAFFLISAGLVWTYIKKAGDAEI